MAERKKQRAVRKVAALRSRTEVELTEDQKAVCERVKNAYQAKKALGYRQIQFAEDSGLSQGYLSQIMAMRVPVSRRSLPKIAHALDSQPGDLDPVLRDDERMLALSMVLGNVEQAKRISRDIDTADADTVRVLVKELKSVLDSIGDSVGDILSNNQDDVAVQP